MHKHTCIHKHVCQFLPVLDRIGIIMKPVTSYSSKFVLQVHNKPVNPAGNHSNRVIQKFKNNGNRVDIN